MNLPITVTIHSRYYPPRYNPHSFEYYVEKLKENLTPALDDEKEKLLNNPEALELMRKFWYEGYDIGHLYGYDDGYESAIDE
jgi:hypothetical protein